MAISAPDIHEPLRPLCGPSTCTCGASRVSDHRQAQAIACKPPRPPQDPNEATISAARLIRLGDAKHVSLHAATAGHFAAVHHYGANRLTITAHAFARPEEVLGRCVISRDDRKIDGEPALWECLPRQYVAYLAQETWSAFALNTLDVNKGISLQTLHWYDESYDKGYQGIVGVTEVPDSRLIIVSVQRSSKLILYDPRAHQKVGEFVLAGRLGNPNLRFSACQRELWADDYDTLLKLEPGAWRILQSRKLQRSAAGTDQFIGQYAFAAAESICAVARPFSGDVIGLNPKNLRTRYRAKLGGQPLEVSVLRGRRVFARDWKRGNLLQGNPRRVWAAYPIACGRPRAACSFATLSRGAGTGRLMRNVW